MNRRNGMWMTILCILVIGFSITRMTARYVASEGTDSLLMEMETAAASENGVGRAQISAPMEASQEDASIKKNLEEQTLKSARAFSAGDFSESAENDLEADSFNQADLAADEAVAGEAAADEAAAEEAVEETAPAVKSPLDPHVETEAAARLAAAGGKTEYSLDELKERLEKAEERAAQYRKNAAESNGEAALAAADMELAVWDKELNLIYTLIKAEMSEEEIEALRISELEWLKERDRAAEEAGNRRTAVGPGPESVQTLAEKTKKRCYELIEEYEEELMRSGE